MTPEIENTVIVVAVLSNIISAVIVLAMGQIITNGAGIRCRLAVIRLIQRACYFALACLLANEAAEIWETWIAPPPSVLWLFLVFMLCCVISFVRHRTAPDIPDNASWSHPAKPLKY